MKIRSVLRYFSVADYTLLGCSVSLIILFFCLFDRSNILSLAASLIGAVALLFNARGNPIGQALTVVFSVLYGIISYTSAYWGEMITYLGMTAPMAVYALIMWLRHPYRGRRSEVAVNRLTAREYALMAALAGAVTGVFFLILRAFDTPHLMLSTLSITTSFLAVYLTARRSPLFALAYAANDLVLITLWILASLADPGYVSVTVCFAVFFVNDLYGFVKWRRMEKCQARPL